MEIKQVLLSVLFAFLSSVFALIFLMLGINKDKIIAKSKIPFLVWPVLTFVGFHLSYSKIFSSTAEAIAAGLNLACFLFGQKLRMVGLTGGIACGKSTVADMLTNAGAFKLIDCDRIAHQVLTFPSVKAKLANLFGPHIFDNLGHVDRTILGPIVFQDALKRRQLAAITSGPIFTTILKQLFQLRLKNWNSQIVLDAPLLFETKTLEYFCHPIIVVSISD